MIPALLLLLLLPAGISAQFTTSTYELRVAHPLFAGFATPVGEPTELAPGSRVLLTPLLTSGFDSATRCYDWSQVSALVYPIGSTEAFAVTIAEPSPGPSCSPPVAVMPLDVPLGPAEVLFFDEDGRPYKPASVRIVASRFGLYTRLQLIDETPARVFRSTGAMPEPLTLTRPARPGDTVILEGTGIGLAAPGEITVELAGVSIPATRVSASATGLDHVEFVVPSDARLNGCYLALRLIAGKRQSNIGSIPVGGNSCDHPLGLSTAQLADLDAGRFVPIGQLSIQTSQSPRLPSGFWNTDSAVASFRDYNALSVALLAGIQRRDDELFQCRFVPYAPFIVALTSGGGSRFGAGERLRLVGPSNDIPMPGSSGFYSAQPTDTPDRHERWFVPGSWRLSGGGPDVTPFEWQFSIPPLVEIINGEEIQRPKMGTDPVFRWDGSRYREGDVVVFHDRARGVLECTADARAGELRVPLNLLAPQPGYFQLRPTLSVERRATSPLLFPLQLVNGKSAVGIVTLTVSRPYDWFIRPVP